MEKQIKKNSKKKILTDILMLVLGFSMGLSINYSKNNENKSINDYNSLFRKISSLPIDENTDSISALLEEEFGAIISEESMEILDDKDVIQQIIMMASKDEIDITRFSNLAYNLEDTSIKLVMQRLRESEKRFFGNHLTFTNEEGQYQLKANDISYDLDDNTLEQIIVAINKLQSHKKENGYVGVLDYSLEKQRQFAEDCVTIAYDMLQLCVTDIYVDNKFLSNDEIVLKVKK